MLLHVLALLQISCQSICYLPKSKEISEFVGKLRQMASPLRMLIFGMRGGGHLFQFARVDPIFSETDLSLANINDAKKTLDR